MVCGYYFSVQAYRVYVFLIIVKCGLDSGIATPGPGGPGPGHQN